MESDDGFVGYIPQSVDPGYTLIIATSIFCILMTLSLPILVSLGELRDRYLQLKSEENQYQEPENQANEDTTTPQPNRTYRAFVGATNSTYSSAADSNMTPVSLAYSTASSIVSHPRIRGQGGRSRRRVGRQRALLMLQQMSKEDGFSLTQFPVSTVGHANNLSFEVPMEGIPFDEQASLSKPHSNNEKLSALSSEKLSALSSPSSSTSSSGSSIIVEEGEEVRLRKVPFFDAVLKIMLCDNEMKRIFQLGLPFAAQALVGAILEIIMAGIVGRMLGTRELSAYVTVSMCIDFTDSVLGGIQESLTTLCSQSIGAGNYKQAGQYVQLSIILFILFSVPLMTFWVFYIGPAIIWLGFDEETARIGTNYAYVLIIDLCFVNGAWESIHGLLDVMGKETYSMIIAITEEVVAVIIIVLVLQFGNGSLQLIGLIELAVGTAFFAINLCYISWKGWFKPYFPGLLGSFAFYNTKALYLMTKQTLSLSLGLLLTEGEWELLGLFASFLGPAEVVVWGLLGALWGSVEDLIESIGDAAEVRCAFLLGAGMPEKASLSAYKSILVAIYTAFLVISITFICGEDIPLWLTDDAALQYMLVDLLPLFGIGSVGLTLGSMCWTIIGAQGRYRLATTVVLLASVCVTLPAAAIFSIALNINLQGQMTAVIMGYMVSGTANAYLLFRTDWEGISRNVIQQNAEDTGSDSVSSSESRSSTSSIQDPSSGKSSSRSSEKKSSLSSKTSIKRDKITSLASQSSLLGRPPRQRETSPGGSSEIEAEFNIDELNMSTPISSVKNIGSGFIADKFLAYESRRGLELIPESYDESYYSAESESSTSTFDPDSFLYDIM